jgi:hypothetical protein
VPHDRPRARRFAATAGLGLALALSAAALCGVRAHGQELIRRSFARPTESQPIQVAADHVATWTEGTMRWFVLRGRVWIEQGTTGIRLPFAVARVDEAERMRTGMYLVELFGDGGVTIDEGPQRKAADTVHLQLSTRGELEIKVFKDKVQQQVLANDPLVGKAKATWATSSAVLQAKSKAPQPLAANIAKSATPLPAPGATQSLVQPPSSGIQQVQAVVPVPPAPAPVLPVPGVPGPGVPVPTQPLPPPPPPPTSTNPNVKPSGPTRKLSVRPRGSIGLDAKTDVINGENVAVVPTGVIITVGDPTDGKGFLDIEADRMVLWTRGNTQKIFNNLQSTQGETTNTLEFYLSGNVEIRTITGMQSEILKCDECYYDVGRNVAIALRSRLEVRDPKMIYPIYFDADELFRLNENLYQSNNVEVYSTILPSDPGLKVQVREATLEMRDIPKRGLFGSQVIDPATGLPVMEKQRYFKGKNMVVRVEDVPVFGWPYVQGDIDDPLGPLENVTFGASRAFGFQLGTTWDIYDLIGMQEIDGTRWHLLLDILTRRGPAAGTDFDFEGRDLFGVPSKYQGRIFAWGIYDDGEDILGGDRGRRIFVAPGVSVPVDHPDWRGRVLSRLNLQEMPYGFSLQTQLALISDRNFLEQYFRRDWETDLNQETFIYLKQQQDNWAWTGLVEPRLRDWITETEWLPRADGYLIGQKFFDLFTYNVHGSAGYARLRPTEEPAFAYSPTDIATETGRFDVFQELSLPFQAGPVKVVPYGVIDTAYYTNDLSGDDQGRLYGAGGLRSSMPLSRLYPAVESDLFNLSGLYHKVVFSGNYYIADSNVRFTELPQLDRFNDDASDQALRNIRPRQFQFNPDNALFLTTSPLFDPQFYALRRLIDNRIDTLDRIHVLQLNMRQRWQTKRGFLGNQHVVDWMLLDMGMSIFPEDERDNFGETLGILQYDWVWNIGDRTALVSSGWAETIDDGPRVFNAGVVLNRPDTTNLYLGYRHLDPLESRAVVASLSYAFSAKYAITLGTVWDFGIEQKNYSVMVTRIGTDLRFSLGFAYNSTTENFNLLLEIVPNLFRNKTGGMSPGMFSALR